ncbi:nucleoporin NDC1-like isoform X1 [Sinocyclocheilus anshuiensis]|uniref:Nucleoporin NDC1 n=1 Tax=Sinocyclocheilus anshuiensis TaxID=1608454 RepID=A0A671QNX7_9TELE|nr:PREDICTED: nucleoporin NDC1-like isoform X1 [Sinocyclocheilus anshuiensis]
MFSLKQNSWFIRKVVIWRAVASIAWSVLLLPVTTAVFVLLSRFSLFHPIQWISDCTSLLAASSTIFSLVVLCGVVLITGFFNLEFYTLVPSIPCSRMALLGTVLHPRQCVHSLVYCTMGMLVMWCASVTIGGRYSTLGTTCRQSESGEVVTCLNEYHLFILLAGAFMGYSHSFLGVVQNMYYVSFQPIQQYKYPRFKGCLPMVVKCSVIQALYSARNFAAFYFFFGYAPKTWISSTLNLQIDSSLQPLDSLTGLLDLSLLYHLSISGTFLYLTWYLTVLLFRIYVTEAYSFPVQSTFTEDAEQSLPKVLAEKNTLVMKFLALQDLALLSQHSLSRRLEVFSLSQPGGHAHNWNAISRECLSLLSELTQRLVAHQDAVASNGRVKSQSASSDTRSASSSSSVVSGTEDIAETPRLSVPLRTPGSVFKSSVGGANSALTAPFTPDVDSPFSSPAIRRLVGQQDPQSPCFGTVQSPHIMRRGPKPWSASTESQSSGSPPASPATVPSPPAASQKPSFLAQWLQNRREQVKSFLAKRVLIMYLFNKLPEASSQALFADSQAHIWALQGLSHLVAASFSEDQFGVVQTTLPNILSCLVVLLEAVDRHFKLPHASSKPVRTICSMGDSTYKTLRFLLRAVLKTTIYKITTTFGEHLNAVNISTEHRKRLQQFLEFKD